MAQGKFPALGQSHRRSIQVTLCFLDEMLCDFEEIAKGRERKSVLFVEGNDLSDEQRHAMLDKINRMRGMLRKLAADLGIDPETHDLSQEICARSWAFWTHLVETQSRYLIRYGELPAGLPGYLDPKIEAFIRDLSEIAQVAGRQGRTKPPSDSA